LLDKVLFIGLVVALLLLLIPEMDVRSASTGTLTVTKNADTDDGELPHKKTYF